MEILENMNIDQDASLQYFFRIRIGVENGAGSKGDFDIYTS